MQYTVRRLPTESHPLSVLSNERWLMWGGVYFCTEWIEEKKRRKSLWGVGLSKAGAGKNLHQLLLWFDKKCVIFCIEMSVD